MSSNAGSGLDNGLEKVVAAETRLSDVQGEAGRLVIAGHEVESLASTPYEQVLALLWNQDASGLGAARVKMFGMLGSFGRALEAADAMDALRGAVAQLDGTSSLVDVAAAPAVIIAAWVRRKAGLAPIAPDPSLPHAEDYLRMMTGKPVHPAAAKAINAYLVTIVDHGMNASTFTARVIASTQSDLVSAITGAIGALKGPLHGGAPGPVLDMLDAVGSPGNAEAWLTRELQAGRRIMGMGHRVYRVRDPRAAVLEQTVEQLAAGVGQHSLGRRLPLARGVEQAATSLLARKYPDRELKANVEFYTAVLLDALGIDRAAFTATFAVGRVGGWLAHVLEQRATGRLIRPASRYLGAMPPPARTHATLTPSA